MMNEPKNDIRCSTCLSSWSQFEFQRDCPECGGGALQIPCPTCTGTCGSMWNRAIADSNDSQIAHWIGSCYHLTDRYAELGDTPRPTHRYLFCFGYATPEQVRPNRRFDDDAESTAQIFIEASSKREAAALGRAYADLFVIKLFDVRLSRAKTEAYIWSEAGYAEWLEEDFQDIRRATQLETPTIVSPESILKLLLQG